MLGTATWILVLATIVYGLFFFAGLFRREAVLNALKKDALGYGFIIVALFAFAGVYFFKDNQIGLLLTFVSGMSLGIGILIALPKNATELAFNWRFVVGMVFTVGGLWVTWTYALVSLGTAFKEAWQVFSKYLDWSQLYGILGILAFAIGLWIFRTIKKS